LQGYQNHYSEHYVDRTGGPICAIADFIGSTNAILPQAFNFDITDWAGTSEEKRDCGHQWPRHWYIYSITATVPEFDILKYGYSLSLEGGYDRLNELDELYPSGGECDLENQTVSCEVRDVPLPPIPTPRPTPTPPQ